MEEDREPACLLSLRGSGRAPGDQGLWDCLLRTGCRRLCGPVLCPPKRETAVTTCRAPTRGRGAQTLSSTSLRRQGRLGADAHGVSVSLSMRECCLCPSCWHQVGREGITLTGSFYGFWAILCAAWCVSVCPQGGAGPSLPF